MTSQSMGQARIALLKNVGILVFITSIHHIYGAIHYQTPWRLHTLHINIPLLILLGILLLYSYKQLPGARKVGNFAILLVVITWLGWVGAFEGFYNHFIKDLLYYGGLSNSLLLTLFPSPTYEMPNDFIFEVTGLLQLVPLYPIYRSLVNFRKVM